jgi:hypothetical protein
LLEVDDEEAFRAGLAEDFGVMRKCSRFGGALDSKVRAVGESATRRLFPSFERPRSLMCCSISDAQFAGGIFLRRPDLRFLAIFPSFFA